VSICPTHGVVLRKASPLAVARHFVVGSGGGLRTPDPAVNSRLLYP
jgi:hypothetical protein